MGASNTRTEIEVQIIRNTESSLKKATLQQKQPFAISNLDWISVLILQSSSPETATAPVYVETGVILGVSDSLWWGNRAASSFQMTTSMIHELMKNSRIVNPATRYLPDLPNALVPTPWFPRPYFRQFRLLSIHSWLVCWYAEGIASQHPLCKVWCLQSSSWAYANMNCAPVKFHVLKAYKADWRSANHVMFLISIGMSTITSSDYQTQNCCLGGREGGDLDLGTSEMCPEEASWTQR